nr:hypothetical protein Iba_chr05bCG1510 [Ipomoea batatas]
MDLDLLHNQSLFQLGLVSDLWGGMSFNTSEPAAIIAPSPIFIFPRIVALAPISAPWPIFGWRSPISFPVPPKVTPCIIETLFAMTAVSPMTTPVA